MNTKHGAESGQHPDPAVEAVIRRLESAVNALRDVPLDGAAYDTAYRAFCICKRDLSTAMAAFFTAEYRTGRRG